MEHKYFFTLLAAFVLGVLGLAARQEYRIKKIFRYSPYLSRMRTCRKCGSVHHKFTYTNVTHFGKSKNYWERMYDETADVKDPDRKCECNKYLDI